MCSIVHPFPFALFRGRDEVVEDIVCGVFDMVALSAGAAALRLGGIAGMRNSGKYCERV